MEIRTGLEPRISRTRIQQIPMGPLREAWVVTLGFGERDPYGFPDSSIMMTKLVDEARGGRPTIERRHIELALILDGEAETIREDFNAQQWQRAMRREQIPPDAVVTDTPDEMRDVIIRKAVWYVVTL